MKLQAIKPDPSLFSPDFMEQVLTEAVNKTLQVIDKDFQATVSTWNEPPDFRVKLAEKQGDSLTGVVGTDNKVYTYIVRGTAPHDIIPKSAKRLHFMSAYRAKSTPRKISSRTGGPSGDEVFAQAVSHPGSAARDFDLEIADRRQVVIERNVTAAILKVQAQWAKRG